jgi:hypothetical protein
MLKHMHRLFLVLTGTLVLAVSTRAGELRLAVYVTAHSIDRYLSTPADQEAAINLLNSLNVDRVFFEVYRSGRVVPVPTLKSVRDRFEVAGFGVAGGIATVPGGDTGVPQEGKLHWFNWQHPETQQDLRQIMSEQARVFDTFIVDDFLCTADTSDLSKQARGERSWSEYRRDLLTRLCDTIFLDPVNDDMTMIIKYPQWYDRFHLFGYDVPRMSAKFDSVWVGTESRGARTQRFGFVPSYESFVNYRWIASMSGDKMAGAWFDHGDTDADDFMDQAYQSVLAGAPELMIFNFNNLVQGHPAHHRLRREWPGLVNLHRAISEHPVTGISAYKPANSDAGGDLYIMDFLGMLGIPLVPVSEPDLSTPLLFLPTQATADPEIMSILKDAVAQNKTVILTAGFLKHAPADWQTQLEQIAGVRFLDSEPFAASRILLDDQVFSLDQPVDCEGRVRLLGAKPLIRVQNQNTPIPFLTKLNNVLVLNTHTFSQKDFDAVGEVLLSPKPLGLLDLPDPVVNRLRAEFLVSQDYTLQAPAWVTCQPMGTGQWFIQNYQNEPVIVRFMHETMKKAVDRLSSRNFPINESGIEMPIGARSRIWLDITE